MTRNAAAVIDPTDAELATANDDDAMAHAFAAIMKSGKESGPPSLRRTERKAREKKVSKMVDGRTLKAKGRTVQINFKAKPTIRQALDAKLASEGMTIADFMERTLEAALGLRSN
jgi:hypothetical protein